MIQSEAGQGVASLPFTVVDDYTTFRAEYTIKENDIIIQFFLPVEALEAKAGQSLEQAAADLFYRDGQREGKAQSGWSKISRAEQAPWLQTVRDYWAKYLLERGPALIQYWGVVFPAALQRTATSIFLAQPPRVQMEFVPELSSWWFKAVGFVILKPDDLVRSLLTRLDQDLEASAAATALAPNAM